MIELRFKRFVAASVSDAWAVITDHEGYADVADNLSKVEVVTGAGLDMRRRCYDTRGRGWNETCVLWNDGHEYSFVVDTGAPDYPYPLTYLRGTWGVEPAVGGAVVRMAFDIEPKWGRLGGWLIGGLMRPQFEAVCRRLLDRWAERILARQATRRPASGLYATTLHGDVA